jgi:hypothetical protein
MKIRGLSEKYSKPVIVSAELFVPRHYVQEQDIMSEIAGVGGVCYSSPDEAAVVMHALATYGEFLRR